MSDLLTYMKYEEQLIGELVELAELQQQALVGYNFRELEKISMSQISLAKRLKEAEDQRLMYFTSWLGISRREAQNITLSSLEDKFSHEEAHELNKLKVSIKNLVSKLNGFNSINRVLANRGMNSVREMLSFFSKEGNFVCNVKV